MKVRKIYYTPEFLKCWKRVPQNVKKKAEKKEKIFRRNLFNPTLRTHKLKGILRGFYSFYVDYHWRIVFHVENGNVYFDSIGTHSIYR